jgi:CheY-like chemotaxis protein
MNILLLEDRGSVSFYLKEALTKEGHVVLDAMGINDAQSYWGAEKIDCLIVDLNMSPDGLKPDETQQTKDGLLTGWFWLRNYVYKPSPAMKQRTIILSEYINALCECVPAEELKGIRLVPKKGSTSPAEQLLDHVKCIARVVERGK